MVKLSECQEFWKKFAAPPQFFVVAQLILVAFKFGLFANFHYKATLTPGPDAHKLGPPRTTFCEVNILNQKCVLTREVFCRLTQILRKYTK